MTTPADYPIPPSQQRRGTLAQVQAYVAAEGEVIYSTSTKQVFIGDGTTAGGISLASATYNNFDFGRIV
jgi:hypothetical protein